MGFRRYTDLSLATSAAALHQLKAGSFDRAEALLDAAVRFDPNLPEPAWARFAAALKAGRFADAPSRLVNALAAATTDREAKRVGSARIVLLSALTAAAVGVALAAVLVLAYVRRYYHDLRELSSRLLPGARDTVVAAVLLLLPLFLGFDLLWVFLALFVGTFGYASRSQKLAVTVGLALAVPLLSIVDRVGFDLAVSSSPILRAAEALQESRLERRVVDDLEDVRSSYPDDVDIRFLLGRFYQALSLNELAIEEYTHGAGIAKGDSRCLVNRGTVRLGESDFGSAQEDFVEAKRRDAKSAAARYNLSLVYAETFRTKEGTQELGEARALDAAQIARFQERPANLKIGILDYSIEEARDKALGMIETRTDRSRRVLGHFHGFQLADGWTTALPWAFVLALALAFGVDRARRRGRGYAQECQKCGRTYCRLCKPHGESPLLCSQCVHVYLKKDGVSIATALQKVEEVRRRKTVGDVVSLAFNIVLPGTTAFLSSRVLRATAALALFLLGLLALFCWDRLVAMPRPLAVTTWLHTAVPGLVAFAGWLLGQLNPRSGG